MEALLKESSDKLTAALDLLLASVDGYPGFDPARAFESCLKFFRTFERLREATVSDTFRDLLQRMHKVGLITDAQTWLNLRDLCNRIAHEYLPEELAKRYGGIITTAAQEMRILKSQIATLD